MVMMEKSNRWLALLGAAVISFAASVSAQPMSFDMSFDFDPGADITTGDADLCSNGLPGFEAADVCCPLTCGRCGGVGCSDLPGGELECCTSVVMETGELCSVAETAPCIID